MALKTAADWKALEDSMSAREWDEFTDKVWADYEGRGHTLDEQSDVAAELRGEPSPGMIDTGRYKIASSPVSSAASGVQRGLGGYQEKGIREGREALSTKAETVDKQFAKAAMTAKAANEELKKQVSDLTAKVDRLSTPAPGGARPGGARPGGLPMGGGPVGSPLPVGRGGIPRSGGGSGGLGRVPYST